MTSIARLVLLLPFLGLSLAKAQEETPPAIPLAEALNLGPEGIAEKLGNMSESGLSFAALFHAAAKRLETENALATKDITLVVELDRYREAVADWDAAWSEAMYAAAGGGTMWAYLASYRTDDREKMLANLAKRMPLKPGSATTETLTRWNTIGELIEKAPVPADTDDQTKDGWEEQKKTLHALWERLGFELQALDNADAVLVLEHILPHEEQVEMLKGN